MKSSHNLFLLDNCSPGRYSMYGTVPCTPCPVGYYSDHQGATECTQCEDGTTTEIQGSSSVHQCQSK